MIYYSHINEDNRIERELMMGYDFNTIVAVAGSGERVLALMDNPSIGNIVAVDLNIEALYLLQLKICMLSNLEASEYLSFIGHHTTGKNSRKNWFENMKAQLTVECRTYWEHRIHIIENGILDSGHFEKFLKKVRPLLGLFLGKDFFKRSGREKMSTLLSVKWNIVTWLFSRRWVYRLMGNKDIAFISTDAAVAQIPVALNRLIIEDKASSSFIAHLIFNGHLREMKESDLPPSLKEQNLNTIKERLVDGQLKINYVQADLLDYVQNLEGVPDEKTFYSISDILSFEDQKYLKKLITRCLQNKGNLIVIRSFLRNRLSPGQLHELSEKYGGIAIMDAKESSGMYQIISIRS